MKKILCIDPGHGKSNRRLGVFDPGATYRHGGVLYKESEIVWEWALTLKYVFGMAGENAVLTRGSYDAESQLSRRPQTASALGATHLLSIHANSGGGHGCESFVWSMADDPCRHFAADALHACIAATERPSRGVKRGSFAVLNPRNFSGPATLLEVGFIDNDSDRARILERDVRVEFAERFLRYWKGEGVL